MNKLLGSSAFALAFSFIVFGIVALILFAAPLWYAWQVTIQESRVELLRIDTQRLSEVFRHEGPAGLVTFMNNRVSLQIPGERILLLTDSARHPLAGNLRQWPRNVPIDPGTYTLPVTLGNRQTRAVFVHTVLPGGYNLLVGRDQALFAPLLTRFWYGLAAAVAVLAIAGVLGGLMVRRAVLLRVEGIRQTVMAIVQGDWGHRLPTKAGNDELDTLSLTINGMLDQIEQLLHGVRDVSNAIAHDLRTPLAELRSRLEELALTRPAADETFAELDAAVVDVDRVIGIFDALLRLAEIDSGLRRSGFVAVDAAAVARQAVDFYVPAAELKGISLAYRGAPTAHMSGDPVLLAQAVGNLIDNALKYTAHGGTIRVEAGPEEGGRLRISVSDNGPGIPADERPKVSTRFYRGDSSRGTPGVGLGLTLVASVAKLHGGVLELTDNDPGLRAHMIVSAQTAHNPGAIASGVSPGGAEGVQQGAVVPQSGSEAASAQSLRIRSVS